MTHLEHIESLVNQFGDDMDKCAFQQIVEKLERLKTYEAKDHQHLLQQSNGRETCYICGAKI